MHAISPTRQANFAEWYQQVIKAADMAENSPVRGCMVIKPWGWSIWEEIKNFLDKRIKETGHQNAYFPLFIPLGFLEKEAEHVEGFAKECAVVTHHRLEHKDGKLIPVAPLEEPYVIRPTSETIIGDAFSKWVQSWRDLPLLINQWANVVRWEMRPRLFLRTAEFLWQEGHTVHATAEEAQEETFRMLDVYREVAHDLLAMPVIVGEKSAGERFPGAENTYTIEAIMQDGKALQCGTSHYLGQNFSKAFNIRFNTKDGGLEYGYTTSWGMTTRLIGALIMTHADDNGLRLPPRVSPYHVVIVPVLQNKEADAQVLDFCKKIQAQLSQHAFWGRALAVHIDTRDLRAGDKNWQWIKRGVPVRLECGPRDIEQESVVLYRRDKGPKERTQILVSNLSTQIQTILQEIQDAYMEQASSFYASFAREDVQDLEGLKAFFSSAEEDQPVRGFIKAKWSMDPASEELLKEYKVTIRCLPLKQSGTKGRCILTGKEATMDAIFAKAY